MTIPEQQRSTIDVLERKRSRVIMELHPDLRSQLVLLLADMGGRVTPWEGYRGPEAQAKAFEAGASAAKFGQSPHNFTPSLAVDVVLHPSFVSVRANRADAKYPDLWDDESPDALASWAALDEAAKRHGLERVSYVDRRGRTVRDLPHLQLPKWRERIHQ